MASFFKIKHSRSGQSLEIRSGLSIKDGADTEVRERTVPCRWAKTNFEARGYLFVYIDA